MQEIFVRWYDKRKIVFIIKGCVKKFLQRKEERKNLEKIRIITSKLAFRIIAGAIGLLGALTCIASIIGYTRFTESLTREYTESAFRTAYTAAKIVDGNKIDEYLETKGDSEEYRRKWNNLNILCQEQNVTLIYAISVDTGDYNSFESVFNTVNENSSYTPWEVGYQRNTTNEEYRGIYKNIYENGLEKGYIARTSNLGGKEPHITVLIPIKDSQGVVQAILCVQRPMEELKTGRMDYLKYISLSGVILIIISAWGVSVFLKGQIIGPLEKIVNESKRFAKEKTQIDGEDLDKVSKITEIMDLGSSVQVMEDDIIHYMKDLTEVTAEKERIGTELALAANIQTDMLPSIFPAFPQICEFDIFASMDPAKEVGGDFYDFFLIDEEHVALVVADVAGKGVPAALFMMMTKIMINTYAMMGISPKEILERVNNSICQNNKNDMFVTVWLGILTYSTGQVVASNAGHECPAIKRAGGMYEIMQDPHNLVIGALEGMPYGEYEFTLGKGDALFVYSDGVPDAINLKEEQFQRERMLDVLNKNCDAAPEMLIKNMKTEIDAFVGEAEQFDDITMLAIQMN